MRRAARDVVFAVRRGWLVRHVRFPDGRGYTQRCSLAVLRETAYLVEARGEEGVTTTELWQLLPNLPCTQLAIALDFLKDCGCVVTEGRRSYPASTSLVEDALTEFHYLAAG